MTAVRIIWGPASGIPVPGTNTVATLNDADNAVAWIFPAPKTGNIDTLSFALSAETGTSPAYNVGLVTVDASGNPTTTAYGGSSAETQTFTSTGYKTQTFGTPAAVTAGDVLAGHIWPTGSAPDGSNSIAVIGGFNHAGADFDASLPTTKRFTTSWATLGVDIPNFGIKYDDGTWYWGTITDSTNATAFDSADTPDEYGAKFTVPIAMTIAGVRLFEIDAPATGDSFVVKLYDSGGSTLKTGTIDADIDLTSGGLFDVYFTGTETLAASSTYRIGVTNSSATNTMTVNMLQFGANSQRAALPEGASWSKTTRVDAGAWTDDDTMVPQFGLIVTDITTSSGGGGSYAWVS